MPDAKGSADNPKRLREFLEGPFTDMVALLDAWERGEADLSFLADDIVYEDANLPDHVGEEYRGHDGLLRAAKRWLEPFEAVVLGLEEIIGTGDRLVSVHRAYAKARDLDIEFREPLAYVWKFREGRVIHFQSFRDRTEAIEVAGIGEIAPQSGTANDPQN